MGRDRTALTFCGRRVRGSYSKNEVMLFASKSFKGFVDKAQLLAVALENTTVKPTCRSCLHVQDAP